MRYDYLIVGAGLFGSVCAYELTKKGYKCLVIDKRDHIAGNIYTRNFYDINVHVYGAHIFHTSNKKVWEYINQFAEFNNYINSPVANYKGKLYNLPFNMNTFNKLWGVITPKQAKEKIEKQKRKLENKTPTNLEEQAISLVGKDVYKKLIKDYTEKQWGKECKQLPPSIIKRLPVRFTYNNNYFNDKYQGIPIGGYTQIIEKMLNGIEIRLNTDFIKERDKYENIADNIIYTGMIDEYYNYKYGELEYRSLRFIDELKKVDNYQGNAVVNYTDKTPYTRIIEHKHFEGGNSNHISLITKEYPMKWKKGLEAYYSVNNEKNDKLYNKYSKIAKKDAKITFGGRLGEYKYYDMDKTIEKALELTKKIKEK